MNLHITAMTLAVFLVAGCSTGTINPVNENADYGSAPSNVKDQLYRHWNATLKDPSSLQVASISTPKRAHAYVAKEEPHGYDLYSDVTFDPVYGYIVCATINAKNSYGGYTGNQTKTYFFDRSGKMHTPFIYSSEQMEGMHRTGSVPTGVIMQSSSCE